MKIDFDDIKIKNNLLCEASSFKLDKHGIYTICGDNGTGKTLLLRTLFINSEADGAYIPQSNNRIISNIDVVENIILFDEAKRDAAIGLLQTFDIDYLIGRKIKKLSGGEKRLICLIRGILSDGELLFIDEPTNDLDIDKVEKLLEVLKKLRAEKYIVMVTHDDRIMAISDALFILKNKKITSKEEFSKEERDSVTLKTETKIVKNANRVKTLLNKIWKDKWYKYVVALIYMFLFVINILTTNVTPVEEQSIKNNIAELYYLNSLFGGIYGNGSLRGDVFLWFTNESKSYFDLMQKLDNVKFMYPTYCLQNLNDTTEYKVFYLEYFLEDECRYIYLDDAYKALNNMEQDGIKVFDYKTIFDIDVPSTNEIELDDDIYGKCIDYIRSEYPEAIPLNAIVLMKNGFSTTDFLLSKDNTALLDSGVFILSSETLQSVFIVNILKNNLEVLKTSVIVLIACVILNLMFEIIYLRNKRNSLDIVFCQKTDYQYVKKHLLCTYNHWVMPIVETIIVVLALYATQIVQHNMIIVFGGIYFACRVISNILSAIIVKRNLNYVYSFKYR